MQVSDEQIAALEQARAERALAKQAAWRKRNEEAAAANEQHRLNKQLARHRGGARAILPVRDGCVMVVSDQHYFPGRPPSKSHLASVMLARKLKPYAIISNGDAIDGACISRWPSSSFTDMHGRPTVSAELGETAERLRDYEIMKFVQYLIWNMGNHDARFETRLAEKVPEYAGVNGFTLKEHYPGWLPAWRTDICAEGSASPVVIVKHRIKSGMHAGQNNVLWSGCSVVTGHDHMLKAYPVNTTTGLHWGIHAGTMAPIDSPQFTHYTEDNPVNWHQGFVFLHFRNGQFTGPELVHVTPDGRALFRGEVLKL
jgi:hypothetical protein